MKLILGALSFFVLVGCDLIVKPGTGTDGSTGATSELDGTWKRPCVSSNQNLIVVANSSLFSNRTAFEEATCATGSLITSFRYSWTGGSAVANPAGAKTLDLLKVAMNMTPQTTAMATSMNTAHTCGMTGWSAGVAKDTTSSSCDDAAPVLYTIYQISGTTMYLGMSDATHDGSTVTKRLAVIDTGVPYTK